MRTPRVPFLLLAAALVAAGCVAQPGDEGDDGPDLPDDASWALAAIPSGDGHDHKDKSQHANLTTPNFRVLGWDPLVSDALGHTAGGHFCGQVGTSADGRRYAVVNSFVSDVSFVVVDVTDAAAPRKVGEYILANVQTYDVAVTPDAKYVVVGANPSTDRPSTGGALPLDAAAAGLRVQPMWRDACTGEERAAGPESLLPLAPSAILVDITDPTNPVLADVQPTPVLGPHSVHAAQVDGKNLAVAAITNLEHQASYFTFYEIMATPLGPKLVTLTTYQAPPGGPDSTVPLINGHVDATIQKHPVTNQTIAYLANWDGGVIVLDITNPRVPRQLAQWGGAANGPASLGDDAMGAIHGTLPIEGLWDGRHYTIAGQELGGRPEDRPTGWVFILDTTDPADPVEVGRWTLPVDVTWGGFLHFSTHYFALVERTLFVSLYHGGVWAVDLSTPENLASPQTLGVFVPDRVSPNPPPPESDPGLGGGDLVLDVLAFPNGDLAVYASESGVYMVRFDPSVKLPVPTPWPVGAHE